HSLLCSTNLSTLSLHDALPIFCERLSLPMYQVTNIDSLNNALVLASDADVVVDAIFGTGLNRAPDGIYAEVIRSINELALPIVRSEEHTSELQSRGHLVCRLLL